MRKKAVLFIIFTLFNITIHAEEKPLVSILPFNDISVSVEEAKIITGLFEVALVKTGAYIVIEQSQLEKILAMQQMSLSSCTDITCAIEIGKLLAADNIFIGSIALLGSTYIITVKLIEISSGMIAGAESIELTSLNNISNQIFAMADVFSGNPAEQIKELTEIIAGLKKQYKNETAIREKFNTKAWINVGISAISAGLAGIFYFAGSVAYDNYQESIIPADITQYRNEVTVYDGLAIGFSLNTAIFTTFSVVYFMTGPDPEATDRAIKQYEKELAALQKENAGYE